MVHDLTVLLDPQRHQGRRRDEDRLRRLEENVAPRDLDARRKHERRGVVEREPRHGRLRRRHLDAHEAQVGARERGRWAGEPNQVHLDEPGEELDERHAWIVRVVVRPARRATRDLPDRRAHQLVEAAAVEAGKR